MQAVRVSPQQTVMAPVVIEGGGDCVLVEPIEDFPGAGQVDLTGNLATSEVRPPKSMTPPPACTLCEIVGDELSGTRG